MAQKFTPGSWKVTKHSPFQVESQDLRPVCFTKSSGDVAFFAEIIEEDKANAHLIAAAPDMYEALQRLCNELDAMHGIGEGSIREIIGNTNYNCIMGRLNTAKLALAKAEGKDL